MLKIIAHDAVNDIAVIQTSFCFNVRYGLQIKPFDTLAEALDDFTACQRHALACEGMFDES
ncbi:hypothetical protein PhaeoP66_03219 [Phaeobacter inhibens]|uniref:Uncharacterized protein n=1 Tax=Phaeobacter inhibens TaxID=221822 RepID=A0ABN5GT68_9RHOB|nr:hypothetical protein [Phaeobacter inhibens]AUQ95961.1 hypothetical protein PhaeoP66_03219 [Phaeobacter inhibens]